MKSLLRTLYRYVVLYEDEESGETKKYAVKCATAAIATSIVIGFIDERGHHTGAKGYSLIPRVSKEQADYVIN